MDAKSRGAEVEIDIERIVAGGYGFGRAGTRPVFVSFAAPGERVRVQIERVQGPISFGSVIEVLQPSPKRQEAPCEHFGRCGGCDLQHLTYEAQLEGKQGIVRDALRRIGGFQEPFDVPITPSPMAWGYRARAEWRQNPASGELGYFRRGSHTIEDIVMCPILTPPLETLRAQVRVQTPVGDVAELHAAQGDDAVALSPTVERFPNEPLAVRIAGESYRFDADCFFQSNHALLPAVIAEVLRTTPAEGLPEQKRIAVDLFCGVGLFSLPLARRYDQVYGVESSREAVQYARGNARFATLNHVKFAAVPAEQWLRQRGEEIGAVEQVVVDPPRTGLEAGLIARLIRLQPERIAYVSCDPATLARDLKRFASSNFEIESVAAFDMFPQNHHVEAVVHLRRIDG